MKFKTMKVGRILLIALLASFVTFTNCGKSSKSGGGTKKFTSKTGWKPNDQKGWFFSNKKKKEKAWVGMVFVEGGSFTMGLVKDDVMKDWNNTPTRMHVRSFFIGETETTNYEYREYTTWLKMVFSDNRDIYEGALPDSLCWINKLSRNDIFTENYFRSPQFDYYPVVGVSWLQAQRYCDWLTDRSNEKELMDKGIINKGLYTDESKNVGADHFNAERYKYNDASLDQIVDKNKWAKQTNIKNKNTRVQAVNKAANTNLVPKFRLPTEAEWEYAALAQTAEREYNAYQNKEPEIAKLKGKKGRQRGKYLDNFKMGIGNYGGIGGWGNDGAAIPADVKSYPANEFGLYSMFGNVAEWVQDVYRPIIDQTGNDFNYFRGNIYDRIIYNNDGTGKKVEDSSLMYDTLSDGRSLYRILPGDIDREVYEDARNFRDGDAQSSLDVQKFAMNDDMQQEKDYYNSPVRNFRVTDDGRVILDKDVDDNRTTDISNEMRVVKGGSWSDTSYWLDPAQRRYMQQGSSASWVGFRVAQDHLGKETSASGKKRGVNSKIPK